MRLREMVPLAVASLGLASALEACLTIEWWYPYCSVQDSGPAPAVFGAPLPYARFAGSSLTFEVMPHIVAADVALIAGVIGLLLAVLVRHAREERRRLLRPIAYVLGTTLLVGRVAIVSLGFCTGALRPEWSIAHSPFDGDYYDYRPMRVATEWHYDCAPPSSISRTEDLPRSPFDRDVDP